jgi:pyrroloquinoline quinone (PQQ) biosynthesis protein C
MVLLENLTEESGTYGEEDLSTLAGIGIEREWIEGVPHPVLFERFAAALGVTPGDAEEQDEVRIWREMLLQVLSTSPAEAIGALGLGTENIVSTMYEPFLAAIATLEGVSPRETVFFPLHTAVDDHHQETLRVLAVRHAVTEEGRRALRRGMLKSLQLRVTFWDWMFERAMNPSEAEQESEEVYDVN